MTYQDKWGHGRVIEKGYRECASRYAIVRDFCLRKFEKRAFTVRDIGANLCYFGLRLTYDFPKCKVTAYESHSAASRAALAHLAQYGNPSLRLYPRRFTMDDASQRGHFDLTITFSILHHMSEPLADWLWVLRHTSDHTIVELATEPSARNSQRAPAVPEGATILGYGESHLEAAKRPIFYLEGK